MNWWLHAGCTNTCLPGGWWCENPARILRFLPARRRFSSLQPPCELRGYTRVRSTLVRGTELRHLFRDLFATSFLCAPQLLLHRGDLEHSNLHHKALAQPSGQPMLITYVCLPLAARFAMRVAGFLSTPSTHLNVEFSGSNHGAPGWSHVHNWESPGYCGDTEKTSIGTARLGI